MDTAYVQQDPIPYTDTDREDCGICKFLERSFNGGILKSNQDDIEISGRTTIPKFKINGSGELEGVKFFERPMGQDYTTIVPKYTCVEKRRTWPGNICNVTVADMYAPMNILICDIRRAELYDIIHRTAAVHVMRNKQTLINVTDWKIKLGLTQLLDTVGASAQFIQEYGPFASDVTFGPIMYGLLVSFDTSVTIPLTDADVIDMDLTFQPETMLGAMLVDVMTKVGNPGFVLCGALFEMLGKVILDSMVMSGGELLSILRILEKYINSDKTNVYYKNLGVSLYYAISEYVTSGTFVTSTDHNVVYGLVSHSLYTLSPAVSELDTTAVGAAKLFGVLWTAKHRATKIMTDTSGSDKRTVTEDDIVIHQQNFKEPLWWVAEDTTKIDTEAWHVDPVLWFKNFSTRHTNRITVYKIQAEIFNELAESGVQGYPTLLPVFDRNRLPAASRRIWPLYSKNTRHYKRLIASLGFTKDTSNSYIVYLCSEATARLTKRKLHKPIKGQIRYLTDQQYDHYVALLTAADGIPSFGSIPGRLLAASHNMTQFPFAGRASAEVDQMVGGTILMGFILGPRGFDVMTTDTHVKTITEGGRLISEAFSITYAVWFLTVFVLNYINPVIRARIRSVVSLRTQLILDGLDDSLAIRYKIPTIPIENPEGQDVNVIKLAEEGIPMWVKFNHDAIMKVFKNIFGDVLDVPTCEFIFDAVIPAVFTHGQYVYGILSNYDSMHFDVPYQLWLAPHTYVRLSTGLNIRDRRPYDYIGAISKTDKGISIFDLTFSNIVINSFGRKPFYWKLKPETLTVPEILIVLELIAYDTMDKKLVNHITKLDYVLLSKYNPPNMVDQTKRDFIQTLITRLNFLLNPYCTSKKYNKLYGLLTLDGRMDERHETLDDKRMISNMIDKNKELEDKVYVIKQSADRAIVKSQQELDRYKKTLEDTIERAKLEKMELEKELAKTKMMANEIRDAGQQTLKEWELEKEKLISDLSGLALEKKINADLKRELTLANDKIYELTYKLAENEKTIKETSMKFEAMYGANYELINSTTTSVNVDFTEMDTDMTSIEVNTDMTSIYTVKVSDIVNYSGTAAFLDETANIDISKLSDYTIGPLTYTDDTLDLDDKYRATGTMYTVPVVDLLQQDHENDQQPVIPSTQSTVQQQPNVEQIPVHSENDDNGSESSVQIMESIIDSVSTMDTLDVYSSATTVLENVSYTKIGQLADGDEGIYLPLIRSTDVDEISNLSIADPLPMAQSVLPEHAVDPNIFSDFMYNNVRIVGVRGAIDTQSENAIVLRVGNNYKSLTNIDTELITVAGQRLESELSTRSPADYCAVIALDGFDTNYDKIFVCSIPLEPEQTEIPMHTEKCVDNIVSCTKTNLCKRLTVPILGGQEFGSDQRVVADAQLWAFKKHLDDGLTIDTLVIFIDQNETKDIEYMIVKKLVVIFEENTITDNTVDLINNYKELSANKMFAVNRQQPTDLVSEPDPPQPNIISDPTVVHIQTIAATDILSGLRFVSPPKEISSDDNEMANGYPSDDIDFSRWLVNSKYNLKLTGAEQGLKLATKNMTTTFETYSITGGSINGKPTPKSGRYELKIKLTPITIVGVNGDTLSDVPPNYKLVNGILLPYRHHDATTLMGFDDKYIVHATQMNNLFGTLKWTRYLFPRTDTQILEMLIFIFKNHYKTPTRSSGSAPTFDVNEMLRNFSKRVLVKNPTGSFNLSGFPENISITSLPHVFEFLGEWGLLFDIYVLDKKRIYRFRPDINPKNVGQFRTAFQIVVSEEHGWEVCGPPNSPHYDGLAYDNWLSTQVSDKITIPPVVDTDYVSAIRDNTTMGVTPQLVADTSLDIKSDAVVSSTKVYLLKILDDYSPGVYPLKPKIDPGTNTEMITLDPIQKSFGDHSVTFAEYQRVFGLKRLITIGDNSAADKTETFLTQIIMVYKQIDKPAAAELSRKLIELSTKEPAIKPFTSKSLYLKIIQCLVKLNVDIIILKQTGGKPTLERHNTTGSSNGRNTVVLLETQRGWDMLIQDSYGYIMDEDSNTTITDNSQELVAGADTSMINRAGNRNRDSTTIFEFSETYDPIVYGTPAEKPVFVKQETGKKTNFQNFEDHSEFTNLFTRIDVSKNADVPDSTIFLTDVVVVDKDSYETGIPAPDYDRTDITLSGAVWGNIQNSERHLVVYKLETLVDIETPAGVYADYTQVEGDDADADKLKVELPFDNVETPLLYKDFMFLNRFLKKFNLKRLQVPVGKHQVFNAFKMFVSCELAHVGQTKDTIRNLTMFDHRVLLHTLIEHSDNRSISALFEHQEFRSYYDTYDAPFDSVLNIFRMLADLYRIEITIIRELDNDVFVNVFKSKTVGYYKRTSTVLVYANKQWSVAVPTNTDINGISGVLDYKYSLMYSWLRTGELNPAGTSRPILIENALINSYLRIMGYRPLPTPHDGRCGFVALEYALKTPKLKMVTEYINYLGTLSVEKYEELHIADILLSSATKTYDLEEYRRKMSDPAYFAVSSELIIIGKLWNRKVVFVTEYKFPDITVDTDKTIVIVFEKNHFTYCEPITDQ